MLRSEEKKNQDELKKEDEVPEIPAQELKSLGKMARYSGASTAGEAEDYRAELKGHGPVRIQQFFRPAYNEFRLNARAAACLKLHAGPFAIPPIGVNTEKQWIIYPLMDGTLTQKYLDIRTSKKQLLSHTASMRILYDIIRALYYTHLNSTSVDEKGQPCLTNHRNANLERDIDSDHIYLVNGYERLLKDFKPSEIDSAPPMAILSESGIGTTKSTTHKYHAGLRGDISKHPFDHQMDIFFEPTWSWRFGLLMFEVLTKQNLSAGTLEDLIRITLNRLKPKGLGDVTRAYSEIWQTDKVPGLIYDLCYFGCWEPHIECRPTFAELYKVVRWAYMDRIAEEQIKNLAAERKPDYTTKVMIMLLGYSNTAHSTPSKMKDKNGNETNEYKDFKITYTRTNHTLEERYAAFKELAPASQMNFEKFSALIDKIDRDPLKPIKQKPGEEPVNRAIDPFALNQLWQEVYPKQKLFPSEASEKDAPIMTKSIPVTRGTHFQKPKADITKIIKMKPERVINTFRTYEKKDTAQQTPSINKGKEGAVTLLDVVQEMDLTPFMKYRLLYDICQSVFKTVNPPGMGTDKSYDPVKQKLQLKNVLLSESWFEEINDPIGSTTDAYDNLKAIAKLGEEKNSRSDSIFDTPPDAITRSTAEYGSKIDVWRLGILAFELFCEVSWDEINPSDQVAIVQGKPVSHPELQKIIDAKWKTLDPGFIYGKDGIPVFWSSNSKDRPSVEDFGKMVRQCLVNKELNRDRAAGIGYPDFDPLQFGDYTNEAKPLPSIRPIMNTVQKPAALSYLDQVGLLKKKADSGKEPSKEEDQVVIGVKLKKGETED